MLGTNDAYHAKGWTAIEKTQFKTDCAALFKALYEKNPAMQFVLMNSPACFGSRANSYDMLPLRLLQSELVGEMNEAGYKTTFFDMFSVTRSMEKNFPDSLHPDKAGHAIMAEALSKTVKEITISIG